MNDATSSPVLTNEIEDLFHPDPVEHLHAKIESLESVNRQHLRTIRELQKLLFGAKSERRECLAAEQSGLLDVLGPEHQTPPEPTEIPDAIVQQSETAELAKPRGTAKKSRTGLEIDATGLRFDDSTPTREVIIVADEMQGADAHLYEVIGYKEVKRIVEKTTSYEVVIIKRQLVKQKETGQLITAALPDNVLESTVTDVSFLVGLLINKFQYHCPLYRQHQKLTDAGIQVSRASLTNWVKRTIELLRPIVAAQLVNVLQSKVLAMDETPIKASRLPGVGKKPGKMKTGYFWPVYGEQDEVVFTFSPSRGTAHIQSVLGEVWSGTLLTDGYAAYDRYCAKSESEDTVHAQCWVHARRKLLTAENEEPEAVEYALQIVAKLYKIEKEIKDRALSPEKALSHRAKHSKPLVDTFFAFCETQLERADLLPNDTWMAALNYVVSRKEKLMVFLENPHLAMDTNHLEREIRVIPMGRKNWIFCWTELGAEHVGIIQSLICTCKLHNINPSVYLTDVLQRVSQHPASRVEELTPRVWKEKFGDNPLKSHFL